MYVYVKYDVQKSLITEVTYLFRNQGFFTKIKSGKRLWQLECDVFVLLVIISKKQKRKRPNSTWKTITAVAAVWSIMPPLVIDTQRDWFYFRKTVQGVPLQNSYSYAMKTNHLATCLKGQKAFDKE